jgi:hypothetical protein
LFFRRLDRAELAPQSEIVDDFQSPHRKNGTLIKAGIPMKIPANEGESAAPTERAIEVTPKASNRSSGATTAIV